MLNDARGPLSPYSGTVFENYVSTNHPSMFPSRQQTPVPPTDLQVSGDKILLDNSKADWLIDWLIDLLVFTSYWQYFSQQWYFYCSVKISLNTWDLSLQFMWNTIAFNKICHLPSRLYNLYEHTFDVSLTLDCVFLTKKWDLDQKWVLLIFMTPWPGLHLWYRRDLLMMKMLFLGNSWCIILFPRRRDLKTIPNWAIRSGNV